MKLNKCTHRWEIISSSEFDEDGLDYYGGTERFDDCEWVYVTYQCDECDGSFSEWEDRRDSEEVVIY